HTSGVVRSHQPERRFGTFVSRQSFIWRARLYRRTISWGRRRSAALVHELTGYEAVLGRCGVDGGPESSDLARPVDNDGDDRNMTAQRQQAIAMRRMVSVVAPHPSDRGCAGCVRMAESADQLHVQRVPVEAGLLARVNHQLLPDAGALAVIVGVVPDRAQRFTVALQHGNAFEREQRSIEDASELWNRIGDRVGGTDSENHQRNVRVAREEAGALTDAVNDAVDAEKDGCTGHPVTLQKLDDCSHCRLAVDTLGATAVDR